MEMVDKTLNAHDPQSTQNGRDRQVFIALSKSGCPVHLLCLFHAVHHSGRFKAHQN